MVKTLNTILNRLKVSQRRLLLSLPYYIIIKASTALPNQHIKQYSDNSVYLLQVFYNV